MNQPWVFEHSISSQNPITDYYNCKSVPCHGKARDYSSVHIWDWRHETWTKRSLLFHRYCQIVYYTVLVNYVSSFLKGYMTKKGHKRKNWTERWFELRLDSISYYVSEDLAEKKGCIPLDRHCCVEVSARPGLPLKCHAEKVIQNYFFFLQSLPDKEGKRNLFIVKCLDKSLEISASDKKKRQEWIQGTTTL